MIFALFQMLRSKFDKSKFNWRFITCAIHVSSSCLFGNTMSVSHSVHVCVFVCGFVLAFAVRNRRKCNYVDRNEVEKSFWVSEAQCFSEALSIHFMSLHFHPLQSRRCRYVRLSDNVFFSFTIQLSYVWVCECVSWQLTMGYWVVYQFYHNPGNQSKNKLKSRGIWPNQTKCWCCCDGIDRWAIVCAFIPSHCCLLFQCVYVVNSSKSKWTLLHRLFPISIYHCVFSAVEVYILERHTHTQNDTINMNKWQRGRDKWVSEEKSEKSLLKHLTWCFRFVYVFVSIFLIYSDSVGFVWTSPKNEMISFASRVEDECELNSFANVLAAH